MKTPLTCVLLCGAVAAAAAWSAPAAGPRPRPEREQLRKLLAQARAKHDLPMLAAAVVRDNGLRVVAAVGVRKRGSAVKVTDHDLLHLGSDTKPITAWLITWLIQQGL